MKILVLVADYPDNNGNVALMYVHVRNMYYAAHGIDVSVLNFAAAAGYSYQGIPVISLKEYKSGSEKYDVLVSHASNLRNHYRFLKKYGKEFPKFVFFFHGHEVLYLNKAYPKPYSYVRGKMLCGSIAQDLYDWLKIHMWRKYYQKVSSKSQFVFVSNWIFSQFKMNMRLSEQDLQNHCYIINNSIGACFESEQYEASAEKEYDFITIRGNLDGSKYGVDLVVKLAEKNPMLKFLIIGRGKFFAHHIKPENVEWIDRTMNHSEMLSFLNKSKCGLLLTREDTQGVMTCEFAAYGIPVITSDIDVCHEFFSVMPNVAMISNDDDNVNIHEISEKLWENVPYTKDETYFAENTIGKEIDLLSRLALSE